MKRTLAFLLLAMAESSAAAGGAFDRSQLAGTWAESYDTGAACRADKPHYTFELSDDGKTLTFNVDRTIEISSGQRVSTYSATVTRSTRTALFIRYNHTIGENQAKGWEMTFVAPGIYRWRGTGWEPGTVNVVVGVRCSST